MHYTAQILTKLKWINLLWFIYALEFSLLYDNKNEQTRTTWVNNIIENKESKSQMITYNIVPFM